MAFFTDLSLIREEGQWGKLYFQRLHISGETLVLYDHRGASCTSGRRSGSVNQEPVVTHCTDSGYRKGNQSSFTATIKLCRSKIRHFEWNSHFGWMSLENPGVKLKNLKNTPDTPPSMNIYTPPLVDVQNSQHGSRVCVFVHTWVCFHIQSESVTVWILPALKKLPRKTMTTSSWSHSFLLLFHRFKTTAYLFIQMSGFSLSSEAPVSLCVQEGEASWWGPLLVRRCPTCSATTSTGPTSCSGTTGMELSRMWRSRLVRGMKENLLCEFDRSWACILFRAALLYL